MKRHLDDLGQRARQMAAGEAPAEQWLEQRRSQRRRRRWLAVGSGCLILAVGATAAVLVPADGPSRTEAVNTAPLPDETAPPTSSTSTSSTSTIAGNRSEDGSGVDQSDSVAESLGSRCGVWPPAIELWPNQDAEPAVDAIADDGRLLRRQSFDGYVLEVHWPPAPRVEYDLDYVYPVEAGFWTTVGEEGGFRLGIDPEGPVNVVDSNTPTESVPGVEFAQVRADDPRVEGIDGSCAEFEFRLFDRDQLIERVGLDFGSLWAPEETSDSGVTGLGFGRGFDWIDLSPIVIERRSVETVPQSATCDGVLVDLDITTYRINGPLPEDQTVGESVASGQLTEVANPLVESKAAASTDSWAVILPGGLPDSTIGELQDLRLLSVIDAAGYEAFVDPETGPTSGPGVVGSYERPIDALKAFFDHPSSEGSVKAGLVELNVDDATVAYGAPHGHGLGDWVTVITTERNGDGWLVTGWTSAGC